MADSPKLGVLIIHGMGSQRQGFSAPLVEGLTGRLGDQASAVGWEEVHWADVLLGREEELWSDMVSATDPSGRTIPLDWASARQFVVHNFGDAIAYHRDFHHGDSAYSRIHEKVSAKIDALNAAVVPGAPIVVMAHSLGAHIMSNYIYDRQQDGGEGECAALPHLVSMVTFGCNIPLFSLAFTKVLPIDLPGPGIDDPALRKVSRWLNFIDRDDVLGWPLKPLYEQDRSQLTDAQTSTVDRIEDREIDVGSWPVSATPIAHSRYWADRDLLDPVAGHLLALLSVMP